MEETCKKEVRELHGFFESWFRGELPTTRLERLAGALAEEFRIISPTGRVSGKRQLVESLREAHGRARDADPPFRVHVEDVRVIQAADDTAVATYEEWQEGPQGRNGRLSSAVFRRCESAPNGVEWVHLHEVWLEQP